MDKPNKKRGFSGLSGLISHSGTNSHGRSGAPRAEAATPNERVFPLLEITKWPTLPAPWSSVDAGETWIWGDFFVTFQKRPEAAADLVMRMQGAQPRCGAMSYHCAMCVFYRLDRSPHGPSHRPIMVIALEQLDKSKLTETLGPRVIEFMGSLAGDSTSPPMIGLFTGEGRFNLGEYEGQATCTNVREHLFEHLGVHLGLTGSPRKIGNLADAHGHPETGLPPKGRDSGSSSSKARQAPGGRPNRQPTAAGGGPTGPSSPRRGALPWVSGALVVICAILLVSTYSGNSTEHASRPLANKSRAVSPDFSAQPVQPTKVPAVTKHVTIDSLNVRSGPGTSFEPIGRLRKYDTVTLLSSDSSGWGRVQIPNGKTGYVAVSYLGSGSGASAREEWCRQNAGQRPRNGEILKLAYRGPHSLTVRNAPGDDAVVKLKDRNDRTVVAMYVGSGQTATTDSVPEGSFRIVYASGAEYSRACGYFLEDLEVSKAETSASFRTTEDAIYRYTAANELTLYRVNDGNLHTEQASLDEFLD